MSIALDTLSPSLALTKDDPKVMTWLYNAFEPESLLAVQNGRLSTPNCTYLDFYVKYILGQKTLKCLKHTVFLSLHHTVVFKMKGVIIDSPPHTVPTDFKSHHIKPKLCINAAFPTTAILHCGACPWFEAKLRWVLMQLLEPESYITVCI